MMPIVKAMDAGYRERQALLKWWDVFCPDVLQMPMWKLLEETDYDTHRDRFIFKDGSMMRVEWCNNIDDFIRRLHEEPVFAHNWLCHTGDKMCEDSCDDAPNQDRVDFYKRSEVSK